MEEKRAQDVKRTEMATEPKTHIGDLFVQFYLIIVGLAVGYSIENFLDNVSIAGTIRFLTTINMLVIWLHSMIGIGASETYQYTSGWFSKLLEFYIEITGAIILIFLALVQNDEKLFYGMVAFAYFLDFILEIVSFFRIRKTGNKYSKEKNIFKIWMLVDGIAVISVSCVLFARSELLNFSEILASIFVLVIVLFVTFTDYFLNREVYFGFSNSTALK